MNFCHIKKQVDPNSNNKFPWRQMPKYVSCIVDAYSLPPGPVNASTIEVFHQDFNQKFLFINMTWDFPDVVNGIATNFEVRIAREYLEPTEMDDPTDYSLRQLIIVSPTLHNDIILMIHLFYLSLLHYFPIFKGKYNIHRNQHDTNLSTGKTPLSLCAG